MSKIQSKEKLLHTERKRPGSQAFTQGEHAKAGTGSETVKFAKTRCNMGPKLCGSTHRPHPTQYKFMMPIQTFLR